MVQRYNQNNINGTAGNEDLRKYNYYLKVLSSEFLELQDRGLVMVTQKSRKSRKEKSSFEKISVLSVL